jgi:hypothetical protein
MLNQNNQSINRYRQSQIAKITEKLNFHYLVLPPLGDLIKSTTRLEGSQDTRNGATSWKIPSRSDEGVSQGRNNEANGTIIVRPMRTPPPPRWKNKIHKVHIHKSNIFASTKIKSKEFTSTLHKIYCRNPRVDCSQPSIVPLLL